MFLIFRLSGYSPFANERDDEDETMASITALDYRFDTAAFASTSEEAKQFVKNLIIRIPEKRPTASAAIEDVWLSDSFSKGRQSSEIAREPLSELSEALKEQDSLEEVRASLVLRTFLQSPYDSPESSTSEDDDEELA